MILTVAPTVQRMLADVLTVTFGSSQGVVPLLRSLQSQAGNIATIWIWHNGPQPFDETVCNPFPHLDIQVRQNGENLGYGAGINRVFALGTADVAVVVNPDVCLDPNCVQRLCKVATDDPIAVLVGGLLVDHGARVNAFALSLTFDGLGVNADRGKPLSFVDSASAQRAELTSASPSGALFAVNRAAWKALGGGALFVESLFLYLEDVALGLRVRRLGGTVKFCAEAQGEHRFSDTTGARSPLKLFHVERNRLWLQRAWGGRARAAATMPFSVARFAGYAAQLARSSNRAAGDTMGSSSTALGITLLRAWKEGLFAPLPQDLVPYLGINHANVSLRQYMAPLAAQLRDPTA